MSEKSRMVRAAVIYREGPGQKRLEIELPLKVAQKFQKREYEPDLSVVVRAWLEDWHQRLTEDGM